MLVNIKIEQGIDYSDLGVDLDSDNITDDANYNRETMEEMDASIFVGDAELETFTE